MDTDRVSHIVSPDGLTLTSTYRTLNGGQVKTNVTWDNEDKAEANYATAIEIFESRIPTFEERYRNIDCGERHKLKKVGRFSFYMTVSPPIWWMPRISIRKQQIRFGWYKTAFSIDWKTEDN